MKLTSGKQENLELTDYNSNKISSDKEITDYKKKFKLPRDQLMNLSNYEKKKHNEFLVGMKDPIWNKIK